jgi:hypothetical protein
LGFLNNDCEQRSEVRTVKLLLSGETERGSKRICIEGKGVVNFGINSRLGKYVNVNRVRLYYEIYGEGNPLHLLHGNDQFIEDFANQIPFFSKIYKVIAVDCRGWLLCAMRLAAERHGKFSCCES